MIKPLVIYIWLHFAFQELKKKDAKLKTLSDEYEERYPQTSWLFLLCKLVAVFLLLANQSQLSIFYTP